MLKEWRKGGNLLQRIIKAYRSILLEKYRFSIAILLIILSAWLFPFTLFCYSQDFSWTRNTYSNSTYWRGDGGEK
jgi:hypothetical protein